MLDAVDRLLSIGINRIELGSTHNFEEGILEGLKKRNADYLTHNFFPPSRERLILNIASENPEIRSKSIAFIKAGIDFAEELGAAVYTIHPGFLSDPLGEGERTGPAFDFRFDSSQVERLQKNYDHHLEVFFTALDEIAQFVKGRDLKIAIETQGSVTKKEFVLFSRPDDFNRFLARGYHTGIGINLNLSHTHLAAKINSFSEKAVIEMLKPRIMAVEVSHSDGHFDDHGTLVAGAWYFDLLADPFFKTTPLIVEARNVSLADVSASCELLNQIWKN